MSSEPLSFDGAVARVRALIGREVSARLYDASGTELARFEGELRDEESGDGPAALFGIGRRAFLMDPADFASAEPASDQGLRINVRDGTTVELSPLP